VSKERRSHFVKEYVGFLFVDGAHSCENGLGDDVRATDKGRRGANDVPVLFKDPVPAIDARPRDRESKTNVFYIPATVPEIESTGLPVRTDSAVDHGIWAVVGQLRGSLTAGITLYKDSLYR
jgi:hypothetical protein